MKISLRVLLLTVCVVVTTVSLRGVAASSEDVSESITVDPDRYLDEDDPKLDNVNELIGYEYEDYIGKDKRAFIFFYTPECPHCKKRKKEWKLLDTIVNKNENGDFDDIYVARMNCNEHGWLCEQFGVKGIPAFASFEAGSDKPTIWKDDYYQWAVGNLAYFTKYEAGVACSIDKPEGCKYESAELMKSLSSSTEDERLEMRKALEKELEAETKIYDQNYVALSQAARESVVTYYRMLDTYTLQKRLTESMLEARKAEASA